MRLIIIFFSFFIISNSSAQKIQIPQGVTMDTIPDGFTDGLFRHHLYKNDALIAMIVPKTWHNNDTRGIAIATSYEASFLVGETKRDSFNTVKESLLWLVPVIDNYFSPVAVTHWQSLRVQPPKVRVKYPMDWSYKTDRNNSFFNSKPQSDNRLVLMSNSHSEIMQIFRTPNTGKLSTDDVIEMSRKMNRAIDLQQHPLTELMIDGKLFKTTDHFFMQLMHQWHYWYADQNEIIYIGVGLLKEDQVRYPEVVKDIISSIKW